MHTLCTGDAVKYWTDKDSVKFGLCMTLTLNTTIQSFQVTRLKQNEVQSARAKSTHKGVNTCVSSARLKPLSVKSQDIPAGLPVKMEVQTVK